LTFIQTYGKEQMELKPFFDNAALQSKASMCLRVLLLNVCA